MSPARAVLFDLDGTLVDSFPGIASAYHHVLLELGLGDIDDADLKQLIGPPIQEALERFFGLSGERLEKGVGIFREHYGREGLLRFSKYPGIDEMLVALRDREFDLYIATSKLRTMAIDVIDHAGWTDLFMIVGGAELDGTRHLKRDVLSWTMTHITNGTQAVAMVGDRAADIVCGRELGLQGIGVTWGYGSVTELTEAGATVIADSPKQLLSTLTSID